MVFVHTSTLVGKEESSGGRVLISQLNTRLTAYSGHFFSFQNSLHDENALFMTTKDNEKYKCILPLSDSRLSQVGFEAFLEMSCLTNKIF